MSRSGEPAAQQSFQEQEETRKFIEVDVGENLVMRPERS